MVKRGRARPKLKVNGGHDEALVQRGNPKPEVSPKPQNSSTREYVPPTSPGTYDKNRPPSPPSSPYRQPPPQLMSNNQRSPTEERLPSRVFFPKNSRGPLPMDDSVTIDSELDESSRPTQSQTPSSAYRLSGRRSQSQTPSSSVYHLASDSGIRKPSPRHRAKLEAWYRKNGKSIGNTGNPNVPPRTEESQSQYQQSFGQTLSTMDEQTLFTGYSYATGHEISTVGSGDDYAESVMYKNARSEEDEDYIKNKQEVALLSISMTAIQLLMICLQFTMCGIAPFEVNPAVGPYPDVFSDWGGKNGYLMLHNNEFWRLLSPCALCIGILHLLGNAFCLLEPIAIFEREWGSFRWFLIYLVSAIGSNSLSVYMDPDTIAVGSSGPLMGLFAAKLAQVLTHTIFDVKANRDEFIRLDQLSSIFCGLIILSILAFFSYIDWSGHLGGLLSGFFAGVVLFAAPIRSCCTRFFWTFLGLTGLVLFLTACLYLLLTEADPSEDLEDACYYFRNVFHISHDCGCLAA